MAEGDIAVTLLYVTLFVAVPKMGLMVCHEESRRRYAKEGW